jgi:conjugative relaxase-like TrwC/TraI family protein
MLTIHPATSAADVKKYFDVADYYTEGQEVVGRWGGDLAPRFGLSGRVDKASFERLCDNLHPQTGEQLTLRMNAERRVGYDFVFSAPKSFSIVEALASDADRKTLLGAFDAAINETMAEIQQDMHCRVRKGGAWEDRRTGEMVWAAFDHSTARPVERKRDGRKAAGNDNYPPDPHRHRHCFAFNVTWDPKEQCFKAGEFSYIKRDGEYFTAVFYARLARRLEGLGYVIDRSGGKEWEIAGVPGSAIRNFSKRTGEVEQNHANRLDKNHPDYDPDYRPEYKHELGAKTRARKQKELTPEQLRQAWYAQLSRAERTALAAVYGKEIPDGQEVTAAESVAFALKHCSERDWAFPERELKRVALLYGLGDVTPEQVAAELPRHGVVTGMVGDRLTATTRELHDKELFLTGFASSGRGTVKPVGVAEGLERGWLDDEQWAAVTGLLTSHDRIRLLDSAAGVGKTTALSVFDRGMKLAGESVTYLGTTTKSVGVLEKDGFKANTVAAFLKSEKMQAAAKGSHVVVDETSMLGQQDAFDLFHIAKRDHLTLTFLGDSRQHSSVTAGSFMRLLKQYGGVTPFRISTIKRQENADHREAVGLMFEGRTLEGFDKIDGLGWVHENADDTARYAAIAQEYAQARLAGEKWDEILLLCPTHAEGRLVVDAVRSKLREAGLIGKEEVELTRWVHADLTEAQRADPMFYRPGRVDMVQFYQRAKGYRIGERVELAGETTPPLPFDQAERFQVYRRDAIKLAVGDVLRFTANGKTSDGHQIRNGSAYAVAGFTRDGIRLENGWLVSKDFGHWKHAIETSPGSQGVTVSRTIIAQSSASYGAGSMEQAYVSASRSAKHVSWYTDDKAELRRAIQRSSLKLVASDVIKTHEQAPPPARESWRRRVAAWQRLAALSHKRPARPRPLVRPSVAAQPERQVSHGYGR